MKIPCAVPGTQQELNVVFWKKVIYSTSPVYSATSLGPGVVPATGYEAGNKHNRSLHSWAQGVAPASFSIRQWKGISPSHSWLYHSFSSPQLLVSGRHKIHVEFCFLYLENSVWCVVLFHAYVVRKKMIRKSYRCVDVSIYRLCFFDVTGVNNVTFIETRL